MTEIMLILTGGTDSDLTLINQFVVSTVTDVEKITGESAGLPCHCWHFTAAPAEADRIRTYLNGHHRVERGDIRWLTIQESESLGIAPGGTGAS